MGIGYVVICMNCHTLGGGSRLMHLLDIALIPANVTTTVAIICVDLMRVWCIAPLLIRSRVW